MYYRWLKRAFDGGLRLIVRLATANVVLCKFLGHDHTCDDMTNVDRQLDAAWDLQEYVDRQDDCELNGSGWYRIARTPAEARQIIVGGQMAVVLGIETDSLFSCESCSRTKSGTSLVRAGWRGSPGEPMSVRLVAVQRELNAR